MIAVGLVLMLLNMISFVIPVKPTKPVDKNLNDLVPGYDYPVKDNTSMLQSMLKYPLEHFDLETVNNTIFESIVHSDQRKIHVYENYLLWLGGKIYNPLSRTQNPRRIIDGKEALCSEVSIVFNSIARINGFQTRFIGLNGHVFSEIKINDVWRIVDPDYGVTYPVGLESLEKNKEAIILMRSKLENRGFRKEEIDNYIQIVQSSEDNTVFEVDAAALSPRLYAVELASEWLKWIVPMMLMFFGLRQEVNIRRQNRGFT